MNVTRFAVKKPAVVIMVLIFTVGLGIYGYSKLGARLFPKVNTPYVAINTGYKGAGAEEVEEKICKPIEDAVSAVSGVDRIFSSAGEGYGFTGIMFTMSTNANTAIMDVQKAIDGIAADLPSEADKPVVSKFEIDTDPIMLISLTGEAMGDEIFARAESLKKELEKVDGVAAVSLEGSKKRNVTIELDKKMLDFYNIGIGTIIARIKTENVTLPSGVVTTEGEKQSVRFEGQFENVKDIEDLRIPLSVPGEWVRIGELGSVRFDYPEDEELVRVNTKSSVGLYIQKRSDANITVVGTKVKNELENIKKKLSPNVKLEIIKDDSKFILSSISEIQRDILIGILITGIIMFLFIRKLRTSIIVLVSIPTAMIATFFMMYLLGFSMNILTLLALSVSIGILVDDSIVVLENIERHLQRGADPETAAIEGRSEIGLAAIAITLCDVVVFAPLAFMSGMVGQFFREFGLTVVCASLFSLLISFTLTPMLASKLLKKENIGHEVESDDAKEPRGIFALYQVILKWSLSNRLKVVAIIALLFVLSISMIPLKFIGTEFLPASDQGRILVDFTLGTGAVLSQTGEKVRVLENHLKEMPEVANFYSISGYNGKDNQARIIVNLVSKSKRRSQDTITQALRSWVRDIPGAQVLVRQPSISPGSADEKPIDLVVQGGNKDTVKALAKKVEAEVRSVYGVTEVENSAAMLEKEINIKIDKMAASNYGVSTGDAAMVLRAVISGAKAGVFRKNGNEYDIMVKYNKKQINTKDKIGMLKMPSIAGGSVYLSQIADIRVTTIIQDVQRMDRQNCIHVTANLENRSLGDVTTDIDAKLKKLEMPAGYKISKGNEQSNMDESFSSMLLVLIISLGLIYMILVMLYQSFLTPAIRMLSMPVGLIGGLVALALTKHSLSLVSLIGVVMLDALVAKGSTLLIDYTNTLMLQGLSLRDALMKAGTTRIRPILMTSFAMITGMLPAALAFGDAAEIKASLAVVLIGGLISSMLFTPVLIPVAYTLIDDAQKVFNKRVKGLKTKKKDMEDGGYEV